MIVNHEKKKILIIDFGSQVTKLIARRIRDLEFIAQIINHKELLQINSFKDIKWLNIFRGPSTVTKKNFQNTQKKIFFKYTNARYLLWITINSQRIWWQNKSQIRKKENTEEHF